MGRHPFAGVYSGKEDMPIEKAISGFRFAYGKHRMKKEMSPPPNCVTMDVLPPQVVDLFERAFSESSALQGDRPKALFSKEKQKGQDNIRERQLSRFLERHLIADHKIPQIGPSRKATLASFGIETAADIEQFKIRRIEGFGRKYTQGLLRWRDSIEQSFVFDPSKGIDPADVSSLKQKSRQRKIPIEKALLSGPHEL